MAMVCKAANKLEAAQGIISLEKSENESALNGLNGVWRLVFSSAFKTGNLGGNRPGPFSIQLLGSPFSLGQVSQRIRVKEVHELAYRHYYLISVLEHLLLLAPCQIASVYRTFWMATL